MSFVSVHHVVFMVSLCFMSDIAGVNRDLAGMTPRRIERYRPAEIT